MGPRLQAFGATGKTETAGTAAPPHYSDTPRIDTTMTLTNPISRRSLLRGAAAAGLLASSRAAGETTELWDKRSPIARSLLDFIPRTSHAGIKDGTTKIALTTHIQSALDSGETLFAPRGVYVLDGPLQIPATTLTGAGRGRTIFRLPEKGLNGLRLHEANTYLAHFSVDLVHRDDTAKGSCIVMAKGTSECTLFDLEAVNANRQGFTGDGIARNKLIGLYARNCGHRGLNFSQGSNDNIITNFHAIDCGFSGFLLGFNSCRNIVTGLRIKGHVISPGLVVHMGACENVFSDAVISDPAKNTEPHMQVGAACTDNIFANFILKGVNNRGILIRNEDVLQRVAEKIGLTDGPTLRNSFSQFKILGTEAASSSAICIEQQAAHGMDGNSFKDFYVDGVTEAIVDKTHDSTNFKFENFRFGSSVKRHWNMPSGRGHRAVNIEGITNRGSLERPGPDLPAQPPYKSGGKIANPYPFPVAIYISGHKGEKAFVKIDGTLVSTSDASNGMHILSPGHTIEVRPGSTSSGHWQWVTLG
jgi:hypothetical protein